MEQLFLAHLGKLLAGHGFQYMGNITGIAA
jgi:hypothetical protein